MSTQQDLGLRGLRSYFVQASASRLIELHHVFRGLFIKILVKLQKTQPYIFHIFVRILFKILPINYKIGGGGGGGGGLNSVAHGYLSHWSVDAPMKVGRL